MHLILSTKYTTKESEMAFDLGASIKSIAGAAQSVGSTFGSALSNVQGALGTASRLAGALNNLSNPSSLISSLRSINLPGNIGGSAFAATRVTFAGPGNADDWRVRLTIPNNFFAESSVLAPLQRAGGLVFPYTPTISISSSASYEDIPITHQNYNFLAYQNSKIDQFTISGPFHVEDAVQAQYWIAAVHFLRSATKMYTGDSGTFSGSPPPILALNGYGDYVFKNVPVIIKSFTVELPADANYIATTVGTGGFSGFGAASGGAVNTIAGVQGTLGLIAGLTGNTSAAKAAKTVGNIAAAAGAISGVANLLSGGAGQGLGGVFPTATGATHVPNKSTLTIVLQPIYSREAVRQFSLEKFVNGGYVNGTGGYV
jgi:hypothetical protein